ncbi:cleft lip and palate transmembrane protein 1-like protein [Actinia tenebrosa]|uniref:Lipid scramblase CLPTM1L n=1 Tax=Actinia tenebrosa TaxID=6105 RepID=A0A6P8IBN4_ACTTE|nr:cleft lip and palate transmembrane protein 1-like protein [Actinia tenebrosa]
MGKINLTTIALVLFGLYVLNSLYVLYHFFYLPACTGGPKLCLYPHQTIDGPLEVALYTSTKKDAINSNSMEFVWKDDNFSVLEPFSLSINVSIPRKTRKNGTLFAHLFIYPHGMTPFDNYFTSHAVDELTIYAVPKDESVNLLSSTKNEKKAPSHSELPVSHWRKKLSFHILSEKVVFERFAIPAEIYSFLRVTADEQYLPVLYADQLQVKYRHTKQLNKTSVEMPLIVEYSPISLGRLRMWSSVHQSLATMKSLGFSDKDLDDIRGLFTEVNMYLLALTFAISIFHILFDFLAFKNDINFWRKTDSMVGLSSRTVVWRCVSSFIIFLYLLDEKASLLVSIPSGIGTLIEAWKLTKAFKIEIDLRQMRIKFGERSSKEKETDSFDDEALYYLKYLIYPLVAASAVYSLIYHPQKSWYSWFIKSLVNGIYVVGFLFMLPQLFVNYRLKSVAHLPWKALMYKAFNTFIDDVFAFIITMPTSHRLACFRDDIVFVVYIYQRWLYPVDKTRVNEYGMSYEDEQNQPKKQHTD